MRFFLGVFEAVLVPAMEITMNMFFTPQGPYSPERTVARIIS